MLVLCVLGAIVAWPYVFGPSDQVLVRQALEASIEAGREGRPGGVLEHLSNSLRINDSIPGNRSQIAQVIRANRPEVTVMTPEPEVVGSDATIRSAISVKFGRAGEPGGLMQALQLPEQTIRLSNVEIKFKKESATRWLVIPDRKWRIVSVEAPNFDVSGFVGR